MATQKTDTEAQTMPTHEHTQDSDCAGHIVDGECQVCGVWHNNECPECHGHGFHTSECPDNDNNSEERW